ncbi:CPBP family glutamic-type intramembrane protease [Microcoleus sp. PH2017_28_MFU_U_A]|uniref:CPBP family glutamic-type intramembrane protease n=1 Tax=Microcoleus sp. PH2017_28_MFU_U_A TaxID=2798838 RepID=UPI002D7FD4DA|nr:CPBP family glutamic-type intramembrane protease [Microcoleus sp. PH2017_28_MFU_U_A]
MKHSRHRALGDSKRTQSEGKTTSVAHCCEASRNPRSFRTRRYVKNPVFLLLAAVLGVACSIAYLLIGSIWPAVVIHWLGVTVWLLLLGGYRRLYG